MSRWMIEKDGSGIEKSGTGIEKSGTGIEKSGTGIESIGKGVRWGFLSCALTAITFIGSIQADRIEPTGSLQLVVQNNTVAASWIIGDSIFSGVATLKGSFAKLGLTEVALGTRAVERNVAGSGSGIDVAGSGSGIDVAGSGSGIDVAGSGSGIDVAGSGSGIDVAGSGSGIDVAGSGSGIDVAGSGSGIDVAGSGSGIDVAGSGSGIDVAGSGSGIDVAGSGSGIDVAGSGSGIDVAGSGSGIDVAGSGSGLDAITITLPQETGMYMEVSIGCGYATVAVNDSNSTEIVAFDNVNVISDTEFCEKDFDDSFINSPGADFQ